MNRTEAVLKVGGKNLPVSNLDKVLYPKVGFTKGHVIDYYIRISKYLLPHLKNRPLTMKRYPNGVDEAFFYEKRCPAHRPGWIKTAAVWSEGNDADIHFCLANDLPSLIWAANLADLELHTLLSLGKNPKRPTMMVFDLDPGPPAHIIHCAKVGLWLRRLLASYDLECFPKTTGSKGLQLYVPFNTPVTFDQTKEFARVLAEELSRAYPDEIVHKMQKSLRTGKVFVDWSQNDDHKTTVCVYSLRAKDRPTVSTPLSWEEVTQALEKGDPEQLVFDSNQAIDRAQRLGDLFEPVLTLKQKFPKWKVEDLREVLAKSKPPTSASRRSRRPPAVSRSRRAA